MANISLLTDYVIAVQNQRTTCHKNIHKSRDIGTNNANKNH